MIKIIEWVISLVADHLGVSTIVSKVIVGGAVTGVLFLSLSWFKSNYDKAQQQIGYDKCQSEVAAVVEKEKAVSDDVRDDRDKQIESDKREQRQEDVVAREHYDALRRDYDTQELQFRRVLRDAVEADRQTACN